MTAVKETVAAWSLTQSRTAWTGLTLRPWRRKHWGRGANGNVPDAHSIAALDCKR